MTITDRTLIKVNPDDLDEASILFYRLWAWLLLETDPKALVLREPEYVVIGEAWALYCNRGPADLKQVDLIAQDTGKPVVCASPQLPSDVEGIDLLTGIYRGRDVHLKVIETLIRAATELPPPSIGRDPLTGRWITETTGKFQIWRGKQCRLICIPESNDETGFTWDSSKKDVYFFRSKSCKREGKLIRVGHFKIAQQKRQQGGAHLNIDLVDDSRTQSALLRLVPAGAGYKVFPRQLPKSIEPIPEFSSQM